MLDFRTYLQEGRDAPLYHGSSTGNVNNMLEENMITSETVQRIDNKRVNGVSLTRSYKFALLHVGPSSFKHGTDVILELDQRKLAQTYKIVPFNWTASNIELKGVARYKAKIGQDNGSEYEEFVIGPIRNLNKYIVKIHASPDVYYEHEKYSKNILIHPKLFIDGKFVNA